MKAEEITVSQISKIKPKRAVPIAEFAARIERRRQETGITDLPRNDGTRRTQSKKALLKAIADVGGKW